MTRRRSPTPIAYVLAWGLALAVGVAATACGRAIGSTCKGAESLCMDKKTALVCREGKLDKVDCKGPLGCNKFQDHANCDDSIADVGDACMSTGEDEYACSPDKRRALVCKNRRFERYLECRGKGGCAQLGQQVSCDSSIALKGDPCKTPGAVACTEDQKQMVSCKDGKFEQYRFCRGTHGCSLQTDTPTCDESVSQEGDPCGMPGFVVCSVDGRSELVCQGSTYMKSRTCRKSGCVVSNRPGRPIECD